MIPLAWIAKDTATNTPTQTFTSTFTPTFTLTISPTKTYTPTRTDTPTATGTPTPTSTLVATTRPYYLIKVNFTNNSAIIVYIEFGYGGNPIPVEHGISTVISSYEYYGKVTFEISRDYGTNDWSEVKTVQINVQGPQTIDISYP